MVKNWVKHLMAVVVILVASGMFLSSCKDSSPTGPSAQATGSMTIMAQRDTDGDGIIDIVDADDDNDGTPDDMDSDDDNDGTPDDQEADHDGDGIIDDHDDDCAEVKGAISSIDGNSMVVYNVTINVDPQMTKIESENGQHITIGDLTVGMWVEVEGMLNADNSMDAFEIEIEDDSSDDSSSDSHGA